MIRHGLFTFASIIALLCCLATVVVWVRSYWISDALVRHRALPRGMYELPREVPGIIGEEMSEVATSRGKILIMRAKVSPRSGGPPVLAVLPWRHFADYPPLRTPELSHYTNRFGNGWCLQFLGMQLAEWSIKTRDPNRVSLTTTYQTGVLLLAWPLFLFATGSFLFARIALRTSHRTRAGLCARCSYNLTGNTSGVCPECGTAIRGKSDYTA